DAFWWLVGADNDLFIRLMKGVKGVEEFFLNLFFTRNKLHIVDNEHVDGSVFIGNTLLFETNHLDILFDECLGIYVEYFCSGIIGGDFIADRLHKVSFTRANAAI